MSAPIPSPNYCAYLLRCWREASYGTNAPTWRFSLEDPHTGTRHGFASLDALMAFLHKQLSIDLCSSADTPPNITVG